MEPAVYPKVIIGLTGVIGAGKTTAADILVQHFGFKRMKFAGPLKDMLRSLGLTEREIEGDRKEKPCDLLCGQTPRHAMITLGTEWGRNMIHRDFWAVAAMRAVRNNPWPRIVMDDCRFVNEANAIREHGGVIWRIVRPGTGASAHAEHESERGQAEIAHDAILYNYSDIEELKVRVTMLLDTCGWRHTLCDPR